MSQNGDQKEMKQFAKELQEDFMNRIEEKFPGTKKVLTELTEEMKPIAKFLNEKILTDVHAVLIVDLVVYWLRKSDSTGLYAELHETIQPIKGEIIWELVSIPDRSAWDQRYETKREIMEADLGLRDEQTDGPEDAGSSESPDKEGDDPVRD